MLTVRRAPGRQPPASNPIASRFADALDEGLGALMSGDLERVRAVEARYADEPGLREFLRSAEAIRRALVPLLPGETPKQPGQRTDTVPRFGQPSLSGGDRTWSAAIEAASERGTGTDASFLS